jgi:hypothetical protein
MAKKPGSGAEPPPAPRCPKCGEPVARAGVRSDKNGKDGVQRWSHTTVALRKSCGWHGSTPVGLEAAESQGVDPKTAKSLHVQVKRSKRAIYVITAAQNATPVNKPFFSALQLYCRKRNATLLVIPYRYKNPTSRWSQAAEDDDWWAPELAKHLIDIRTELNPNLILLADIKTQPTATSPLTGFETITGGLSAIIGHPKLELVSVATPQSKMAKVLTTTGAITERNYIPSKAGKKGEFHHTFGAALVEVDGKAFYLRQINAVHDGSFIDLDTEYRPDGTTRKVQAEALAMGDSHIEFIDPGVVKATFGKGGIVPTLKPKRLIWHDAHDFFSRNHHHRGEVFINLVKHRTGRDDVEKWLDHTFDFIDQVTPAGVENIFVPSNHPDALARWVKETDPRTDLTNCVFWARTFEAMANAAEWKSNGASTIDPFAYWAKRKLQCVKQCTFLARGESYNVLGIELSMHGDKGANGSRGSIKGFARIGVKSITGHGHAPGICEGHFRLGTNSLIPLDYQVGSPSSHLHADAVVYANGKRSLLIIIGDKWRLD